MSRNEAETRHDLIDPALKEAGWGGAGSSLQLESRIRLEYKITKGRILATGKREKALIADYVLEYQGERLAVIEAKQEALPVTEGLAQAKEYAAKLGLPFAFCTNGHGYYEVDMRTGDEGPIDSIPSPAALAARVATPPNEWQSRFNQVPFETGGGRWELRFYQELAIEKALEAIAAGKNRILLTLATGTGKTAIAFQIAWKLFESKWNLSGKPTRRPRILFLADRNVLADQAFNSFGAFQADALKRIRPADMAKKAPTNASVFFTIFQSFMVGAPTEDDAIELAELEGTDAQPAFAFGQYPPDFFDLIVIDECHRGGANDESSWRGILEYFKPAVQLGLTATPKRDTNTDTYAYFGEPVYTYSLKEGINDGYLTPFRVRAIQSNLDDYVYRVGDEILAGDVEPGRVYTEKDFNTVITIREREESRVREFLAEIGPTEKTLVFCATQEHAAIIRDLINQNSPGQPHNYCVRVTANDGAIGDQYLASFQDNEKLLPTVLTTSVKLSTGVDALNVRNIVLLRPVNSMIEFKQIIGRGTRLYEGKNYFTVFDFVKAYHHFADPEWDGEPQEPEVKKPKPELVDEPPVVNPPPVDGGDSSRPRKIEIQLPNGQTRRIQYIKETLFFAADGRTLNAQEFIGSLYNTISLPEYFSSEDQLREIWSNPTTRRALLNRLAEAGFPEDDLVEIQKLIEAEDCDLFDVLSYVAFAREPMTRLERVIATHPALNRALTDEQSMFVDFVLQRYVQSGVTELDDERLPLLLELKYNAVADGTEKLGGPLPAREVFLEAQQRLYRAG